MYVLSMNINVPYTLHFMWLVHCFCSKCPTTMVPGISTCLYGIDTKIMYARIIVLLENTLHVILVVEHTLYCFVRYLVLYVMYFLVKYKYQKRYGIALKFTKCYDNGTRIYSLHTYKENFARNFFLLIMIMISVVVSRLLQQQQRNDGIRSS